MTAPPLPPKTAVFDAPLALDHAESPPTPLDQKVSVAVVSQLPGPPLAEPPVVSGSQYNGAA